MSRPLRIAYENALYHITSRGQRRENIFFDDKDKNTFIRKSDETFTKYGITCYAYCLMDNHYHLFIKTAKPNLSQALHYLNTSYANWFGSRYQMIGSLFQGRFKSILVDADSYALILSAYMHLNPIRAGIVSKLEDYPWSSYLDYLGLRKSQMVNLDPSLVLHYFSADATLSTKKYKEYLWQNQSMEDPLKQSYHNIALGDDHFIKLLKSRIAKKGLSREIPVTRSLPLYSAPEIIEKVCDVTHLDQNRLMSKERGNRYRSLALYLIKKFTPLKLTQIGQLFDMDYSAVSQAVKRFENKFKEDRDLERTKEKVISALKKE
ncbi:MAG TPA: chromosomal replication initiator DnaA [Candidatus Atribacteria bacterium]|nr:chromosomal replication initiator DnaA [Candidatus Atribacteria bacterium]